MKCADCGVPIGRGEYEDEHMLSVAITINCDGTKVELGRCLCAKCYKKWHKRIQSFVTEFLELESEK